MLAFDKMLIDAAKNAGIEIPSDLDNYNRDQFPHWYIFCISQLGRPCPFPGCHYDNAKIISSISKDEIQKVSLSDLEEKGFL